MSLLIVIIGAAMAGISPGRLLADQGHQVQRSMSKGRLPWSEVVEMHSVTP